MTGTLDMPTDKYHKSSIRPKIITVLLVFSMLLPPVMSADSRDVVRQAGFQYAKPLEAVMVDGPFYVEGMPYYVADYIAPDTNIAASLVFDPSGSSFITDRATIRKTLATKDLKRLTIIDPLFYGYGDPDNIVRASKYETQSVRNFAGFSSITTEERNILEIFLNDYENVMADVSNISFLTQKMLYPQSSLEIDYVVSPPAINISLTAEFDGGVFSYEGFEALISSYNTLYRNYLKLASDLAAFGGGLPEYQPGAIIREKWDVQMTKESIIQEILLVEENGVEIEKDIGLREQILKHGYDSEIEKVDERLGRERRHKNVFLGVLARIKNLFMLFLGITLISMMLKKEKSLYILLIALVTSGIILPHATYSISNEKIPSLSELVSGKVDLDENIPYTNHAINLTDRDVEEILKGFRLILKGESVDVRGPYRHYGAPYYFVDIQKNLTSTGNGFLVDADNLRLVGDQRQAFQLIKTLLIAGLVRDAPLYQDVSQDIISARATETLESPLDLFLTNLSTNVREGSELEKQLIEEPDYEILLKLAMHYVEAYFLLHSLESLVSEDHAMNLTDGFSKNRFLLDGYARASIGLTTEDYLIGRLSQYRGRTLNRIPLIMQLSAMGLRPSKAQVAHDLTSDLIHDNIYLWRKDKVTDPVLFARLAYREGIATTPKSAEGLT